MKQVEIPRTASDKEDSRPVTVVEALDGPAAGSTGLGLSIVAAVAAAHGGSVSLDSEPGDTTFTVVLPA